MSDTYQLADQFLYESSLKSDSTTNISKNKRIVSVSDGNFPSYSSGIITYDVSSQLTGGKGFASLRDAYIALPYVVTLKNTGAAAMAAAVNRFCVGLKTGVWNVVDSLALEINNQSVVTEGDYRLYANNIRAMTEWSQNEVVKNGAEAFVYPDDWQSMSFSSTAGTSGDGFTNNNTNTNGSVGLAPEGVQLAENTGFINRVTCNPQPVSAIASNGTETAQRSSVSTTIAQQNGKGAFVTTAAAAGQIAGTWYHMLKIRLVDLHPIFKELDLVGNPQIKLKLKINSGFCDIGTTSTTMTLTSTTMTSGNTVPVMIASAAASNAMNGVLSASAGSLRLAFGPLQNNLTPVYDIAAPTAIVSKPIKTVRYLETYAQYITKRAGTGAQTTQQNASFAFQLSGSWKNIKTIALIPFSETTTCEQFQSPFDTAPWTCQPGSAIKSFQVQIGNENLFSKTVDYDFESFNDEFKKIGAINGSITHEIANGLIDAQKWATVQRILVADCSRLSNKDVPQSVIVSGTNACCQGMNALVLVSYEKEIQIDRLTGECYVTTA
ncbi:TPA: hypothetical protein N0F65_006649 [Lagenidium giganteum]|uniref:Uncharacterized protein n=1 Tax=Lagenidium giganteum TaxID=4803 RepID=A0AAV2ZA29_9STRA|nr:TPA: hypothetical protein N0F65_006649 [Lagenidium giganteum]